MIAHKSRIERLEGELGPSDLISVWVTELRQFDSPLKYFESALCDQESHSPECQLLTRARAARHGSPDVSLDEEIFRWLRRMLFLKTLLWAANTEVDRVVADCRSRLEVLDYFRNSDARRQSDERLSSAVATASEAKENIAIPVAEHDDTSARGVEFFAIKVHHAASDIMVDLRAAGLATESISGRFLQGRSILFRSIARDMDRACQAVRICAEKLPNTQSADRTGSERLEKAAQDRNAVLMRRLVDYAKATVALRFGEKTRALEALRPHLSRGQVGQGRPPTKRKSKTA
jgi:hypothetical protein